jgi:chromosome segregation ATPase
MAKNKANQNQGVTKKNKGGNPSATQAALAQQVTQLTNENNSLRNNNRNERAELFKLREETGTLKAENERLGSDQGISTELKRLQDENKYHRKTQSTQTVQINDLRRELNNHKAEMRVFKGNISAKDRKITALMAENNSLRNEISTLEQQRLESETSESKDEESGSDSEDCSHQSDNEQNSNHEESNANDGSSSDSDDEESGAEDNDLLQQACDMDHREEKMTSTINKLVTAVSNSSANLQKLSQHNLDLSNDNQLLKTAITHIENKARAFLDHIEDLERHHGTKWKSWSEPSNRHSITCDDRDEHMAATHKKIIHDQYAEILALRAKIDTLQDEVDYDSMMEDGP